MTQIIDDPLPNIFPPARGLCLVSKVLLHANLPGCIKAKRGGKYWYARRKNTNNERPKHPPLKYAHCGVRRDAEMKSNLSGAVVKHSDVCDERRGEETVADEGLQLLGEALGRQAPAVALLLQVPQESFRSGNLRSTTKEPKHSQHISANTVRIGPNRRPCPKNKRPGSVSWDSRTLALGFRIESCTRFRSYPTRNRRGSLLFRSYGKECRYGPRARTLKRPGSTLAAAALREVTRG